MDSGTKTSIRGLSIVDDEVFWASGSNGMVARSTDGGKTIQWQTVQGYEGRDFRDVEAFDANTAIIMAVAEPAIILKTKDGGKSWMKVLEDSTKGMFLDAMDFVSDSFGIVAGDPVENKPFIGFTTNGGDNWNRSSFADLYNDTLVKGEAFFASSGTNVKYISSGHARPYFFCVTGGNRSRLFKNFAVKKNLAVIQGKESTGANSIAVHGRSRHIIIVGGDFKNDRDTAGNCVFSNNFGKTWQHPQTPPHGYRSCVAFITDKRLITCGTSGVDISNNGGNNWKLISPESYHVCQKAKRGTAVFLAGKDGRIAKIIF